MKQKTDSELVDLARNDDELAKEELFRRSKDVISYSVRKYKTNFWKGLDKPDVEDLVSECYIAVMEAIRLYDSSRGAAFPQFLKYTIRFRLYNWVEKKIKDFENITQVSDARLNKIMAPEDYTRDLTIKVKNKRDRYIIDLFLDGMRQTDIADELKITRARVNQIIKSCIK